MDNFEEDIDEVLHKAKVVSMGETGSDKPEDEFELELYLSTDGKHTVHGKATTRAAKAKLLRKSMQWYDYILERYGTKQKLNKDTYKEEETVKVDPTTCPHPPEKIKHLESHTPKNNGRWFKSCTACGKFMGWTS